MTNICSCGALAGYQHAGDCPFPWFGSDPVTDSRWANERESIRGAMASGLAAREVRQNVRGFGFRYAIELTDHHPTLGGKTQVQGWHTRKEATWYGDREVEAARELGIADVTYRVIRLA